LDDFAGGGAPPGTPRRTLAGSGSFGKRARAGGGTLAAPKGARGSPSLARPSVATARRPPIQLRDHRSGQVQRKALARSLLVLSKLAAARSDVVPGLLPVLRVCIVQILAGCDSRDGSPEVLDAVRMGPVELLRRARRERTVVRRPRRARAPRARARPGLRVSPSTASCVPLQSVLPVADRCRLPGPCLPGVARAAFPRGCGAPSRPCSLDGVPGRSWRDRWVLSWGSPL
jgi:hypothetical protein